MEQQVSRPERWLTAVDPAIHAFQGLEDLYAEWAQKLEELNETLSNFRATRSRMTTEFDNAIARLAELQIEYDWWQPDNHPNSKLQQKIRGVQDFNFHELRDRLCELPKFALEDAIDDATEEASAAACECFSELDLYMLNEAKQCDLPKGWGRD